MVLGILPHKMMTGCDTTTDSSDIAKFEDANSLHVVTTLKQMLQVELGSDAHFTCYSIPGLASWPRLNKPILSDVRRDGFDIVMDHFAFDWDTGEGEAHIPWNDEKLGEFCDLMEGVKHPLLSNWSAMYTTARGARLIYTLSEPVPVDKAEKNIAWMIKEFQDAGFTTIDTGCKDWTRFFRCPRVIRDGKKTSENPYFCCEYREDIKLDIKHLGAISSKIIPNKKIFNASREKMPNITGLDQYLIKSNGVGRPKQTEFFKRSRKILKDSPYYDIFFNTVAPDWEEEGRNNSICKCLGVITPILMRKAGASIQQIFALVMGPVMCLTQDQDWPVHTWNALLDIYGREVNKLNIERAEKAKKLQYELQVVDRVVEGMKKWCKAPELFGDDEEARNYAIKNLLVAQGNFTFFMGEDGYYLPAYFSDRLTIPHIRRTFLKDLIPTSKESGNGEMVDVNITHLLNNYTVPVQKIYYRVTGGELGFIEEEGEHKQPALVLNMYRRNPMLKPTYNATIDGWLYALAGKEYYEDITNWIAHALAFEEGAICALSLQTSASIGKKMLMQGLAECLETPAFATGSSLGKQSGALLETPFLSVNEYWPGTLPDKSISEVFKSYVSGDAIDIDEKYKPRMTIFNNIRMVLTANNDNLVKQILHSKALSYDDRVAIGIRLFHIEIRDGGAKYLEALGNYQTTKKPGANWITPGGGGNLENDYILAKHFLWLYENRKEVGINTERLLMMGNCAPGGNNENLISKMMVENHSTSLVCKAILGMVDSPAYSNCVKTNKEMDKLFVTRDGIERYCKVVMEERNVRDETIKAALRSIMTGQRPVLLGNILWHEIDLEMLNDFAQEVGISKSRVRTLYGNRFKNSIDSQKAGRQ